MSSYVVLLDACVLYPAPLRSYLMYLAASGLYRARWTNQIHEEWISNLLSNRPDLTRPQLERTRNLMNHHAPDCLIVGYEPLIDSLDLPDVDDRHVLAAAIRGQAEAIITFNLKDFPNGTLSGYGISAIHPDEFLSDMLALSPGECVKAAASQRAALRNPTMNADEYLLSLQRQGLPRFVSDMQSYRLII
ncbi:PIN domain-containing protein [Aeromonas caviae]|uniref:PIN domain-containing protein n=1 Tax=Aeromonas caviae TaxID=648 RepID=A0AAJ5Z9I8_AERCA|nr:PIN domain-containing protein [Aeromonas caviae]WFF99538.1 PIN domain-containing protein [Aeromonas caviae]